MDTTEREIRCRQCREHVPLQSGHCPHCGAAIRSRTRSFAAIAFGAVVAAASATDPGRLWFYGAIGLALAATGAYFLYDRQRRIRS